MRKVTVWQHKKRLCLCLSVLLLAAAGLSPVQAASVSLGEVKGFDTLSGDGAQEEGTSSDGSDEVKAFVMPTGDMGVITPSAPMEMLSGAEASELNAQMAAYEPGGDSLLRNRAEHYYYYMNLDPTAKQIYDVMYTVAEDPVSEGNIGLMMTDMDPQSDEYYYEFNVAYRALCFDHPELFWLYSGEEAAMGYFSEAISQNGFYFVYILMTEPFLAYEEKMTAFNQAADAFLAQIDTSGSEYQTIRQVHDRLIELVNYNDPVAENLFPPLKGQDLAHTAYGALVTDSQGNPNYAVCDGYTLAFEYLLQQCGIDALFIGGMAGSDEAHAGGHAWSMVQMDGIWYEVDTTWDDAGNLMDDFMPGSDDYTYLQEALGDSVYREKIDHYLFLVSTDFIRHFIPDDSYDYVTRDQKYVYRLAQESVHIRMDQENDKAGFDSNIISLAPVASASY